MADETQIRLSKEEVTRYSRQLILDDFGVEGQIALKNSNVLIVGGGGLGCPAAAYLAASGVGRIGIVDYDFVEVDNLHRQILHTETRIGQNKSSSIIAGLIDLNSHVVFQSYEVLLNRTNALSIIRDYDVVADCSDNVPTRYLLNDACVLLGKPLVSGSALRFEGQLTVYNYEGGPCYRCLFPKPPPPGTVTNCSDGGVLGVVPGIIGSLQALEVIKVLSKKGEPCSQKMIIFDGLTTTFRNVKLRARNPKCEVCGDAPTITELVDYELLCGSDASDKHVDLNILGDEDRVTAVEYRDFVESGRPHVLLDVRPKVELGICALPRAYSLPINDLMVDEGVKERIARVVDISEECKKAGASKVSPLPVFVVCRKGNDSQLAVKKLMATLSDFPVVVKDVLGGFHAWAKEVDNSFPIY